MAAKTVEPPTDLFPRDAWVAHQVDVPSGASVFALVRKVDKASKLPLILIHGYPQNSAMWATLVRRGLPPAFEGRTLIIPDLPGYGRSTKMPSADGSHTAHSKRAIGQDLLDAADALLETKDAPIVLIGHDRGARVAFRTAVDHPERVRGLSVADIVPMYDQFASMNVDNIPEMLGYGHWVFLAMPAPLPETLISAEPRFFHEASFKRWGGTAFKPSADELNAWVQPYVDSRDCIVGSLEDYRAGATIDLEQEKADRKSGAKVQCPTLVLYSASLGSRHKVEEIWRSHVAEGAPMVQHQVGESHFIYNEATGRSAELLDEWLRTQIDV